MNTGPTRTLKRYEEHMEKIWKTTIYSLLTVGVLGISSFFINESRYNPFKDSPEVRSFSAASQMLRSLESAESSIERYFRTTESQSYSGPAVSQFDSLYSNIRNVLNEAKLQMRSDIKSLEDHPDVVASRNFEDSKQRNTNRIGIAAIASVLGIYGIGIGFRRRAEVVEQARGIGLRGV